MTVRRAQEQDIPRLIDLLHQVLDLHAKGRGDIFRPGTTKYNPDQLREMLKDETAPIFVLTDETGTVQGYAMCMVEQSDSENLWPRTTVFIDDLCVDERCRGKHYGMQLYEAVKAYAKSIDAYHITLNVWTCNPDAIAFYQKIGLKPMKEVMEEILG